eukprot:Pgem_evm1s7619
MPHFTTNRPRHFGTTRGVLFILGSVFFLPQQSTHEKEGAWLFLVGSVLYLIVSLHEWYEEIVTLQSDLSQTKEYKGKIFVNGSWLYVGGSIAFIIGATINILMMYHNSSPMMVQLLNATAVCFIVGSVLFILGSLCYVLNFENSHDADVFLQILFGGIEGSKVSPETKNCPKSGLNAELNINA